MRGCYRHGEFVGGHGTPEYKVWQGLKDRCLNPGNKDYHRYGARGVTVFHEWVDSYTKFLAYLLEHLGRRPTPTYSIDRIDNNKGYEPGNIQWSTVSEQARNRRSSKLTKDKVIAIYTSNESTGELAKEYGVSPATICDIRKSRCGRDITAGLPTPTYVDRSGRV